MIIGFDWASILYFLGKYKWALCVQVMMEVDISHEDVTFDLSSPHITIPSYVQFCLLFWRTVDILNLLPGFVSLKLNLFVIFTQLLDLNIL